MVRRIGVVGLSAVVLGVGFIGIYKLYAGNREANADVQPPGALVELEKELVEPAVIAAIKSRGPVELMKVEAIDEEGEAVDVAVFLATVGAAVIGTRDTEPIRVAGDYALQIGDIIHGGVVENRSSASVRLFFRGATGVTLSPGHSMYVGSRERLKVSAQTVEGLDVVAPVEACEACVCKCSGGVGNGCSFQYSSITDSDECSGKNGQACLCEGATSSGTLHSCQITTIPCPPSL